MFLTTQLTEDDEEIDSWGYDLADLTKNEYIASETGFPSAEAALTAANSAITRRLYQ